MTARRLAPGRLVIASHNHGKVREIGALLAPFGLETVSVEAFGQPVPDETAETFAGNAAIKAWAAARISGLPALADDSGLCVDALGGDPGVRSADWAGEPRDFDRAMARVEAALGGAADRRAGFVCALALAWPDDHIEVFEGEVRGRLVWPPRGENGFGYDAMFVPEGYEVTFGEMDPSEKQRISHRAAAFAKMAQACCR